jgi:hypothetical protein
VNFYTAFGAGLVSALPGLIFWVAVLIAGIVLLYREGSGRAEEFLILGTVLQIAGLLLSILVPYASIRFILNGDVINDFRRSVILYKTLVNIVSMAGIICLIYAFWLKFKERKTRETGALERESHD